MIKNKLKLIIACVIFLAVTKSYSQDSIKAFNFSLEQAQKYALENNVLIKNAQLDIEIAKKKVWETTAIGLPQVSGKVEYQDMLDIPTSLMPDFLTPAIVGINQGLFGLTPTAPIPESKYMPVKFGTQHNANWGITATELLFSGEYIVGLQASRAYLAMSKISKEKSEASVKKALTESYYFVLIANKSCEITDSTYLNMVRNLAEMQKMLEAGFVQKTDVEQLRLTVNSVKNTLLSLENQKSLADKMLKFQLGIPLDNTVVLTDDLNRIISQSKTEALLIEEFIFNKNIDYKLLENQEALQHLSLKREESKYLPTVSAFATYSKNAMRDEFNFFDSGFDWFPTSIVGLQISVPIFSSGQRWAKVKQEKLKLLKLGNLKNDTKKSLDLKYTQTRDNLVSSINKFENTKENFKLSKSIYDNTLQKYKQGVSSSMDLTQAQNQYLRAQADYFTAMAQMLNNKSELEEILNK
ncbi:MAG: TolC family protein [Bacteroidetes bacterium]|nr:TolC family protein [Bacteroidota bacterium]